MQVLYNGTADDKFKAAEAVRSLARGSNENKQFLQIISLKISISLDAVEFLVSILQPECS